jgi:hypothetical protein
MIAGGIIIFIILTLYAVADLLENININKKGD